MSSTLETNGHTFGDSYRLDRLVDDFANRESPSNLAREDGELPEHIPLSHNDKYLTAEVFNVEEFLLARSHTSLPDLRSELRKYLAELKEELVQLINDDYEAFISLSTDLRDEGTRLERLKYPLSALKVNVLESKKELQIIQNEIHDKLAKRTKLREEKALLHLLLKISESITRLESMLLITSPESNTKESIDLSKPNLLIYPSQSDETSDEKFRGNRAKNLGRVSAEYTQLLYHVRKAQAQHCDFVNQVQWRIDRLQSTLSSDLDQLFGQTIVLLTDQKGDNRGTDLERNKWLADLTECLRTYDVLSLWRDAEEVLRKEVVRAFVKKTIYPGALMAPHSPLVPHTPFHFPASGLATATATTPIHQIPYTPFTAFIPKQNISRLVSDLPQAHLLEDADDSLAKLYNQLLRFIERDVSRIMNIAEKVSVKNVEGPSQEGGEVSPIPDDGSGDDSQKFQIMANVIWDEFGRAIMDEIGSIVFAAGKPNEFRKQYETTQGFICSLELLAPSMDAVEAMRRHPTYIAFERRWQLPVYFQLRWKEIVGTLEDMFSVGNLDPITPKDGSYSMPQSSSTWIAVSACWSSEIYIPELSHRFWRLTLQILNRYKGWMEETLANLDFSTKVNPVIHQDKVGTNASRTSTPGAEASSSESNTTDDASLRHYAAALADIRIMEANVINLWRQVISMMLPDFDEDEEFQAEDALRESLSALTAIMAPLSSKIVAILTKRCCDGLKPVRNIPAQFRAMTNKRIPTEASYFVPAILRPVKQFFAIGVSEGPGSLLKDQFLKNYATEVFDTVAQQYISYLTAMKKMEVSLKRMVKTPFSLFGNASNARDEGRDEERIRSQMILDVEAFGIDGELLDVDVNTNPHFKVLKQIVHATDHD